MKFYHIKTKSHNLLDKPFVSEQFYPCDKYILILDTTHTWIKLINIFTRCESRFDKRDLAEYPVIIDLNEFNNKISVQQQLRNFKDVILQDEQSKSQ